VIHKWCLLTLTCVIASVWPARVYAYNCTSGGEQVSTWSTLTIVVFENPSSRAVYLKGGTTRSEEDRQNCPGGVRVEGWIEGDPNGAMVHQAPTIASLGYPGDGGPLMAISCAAAPYSAHTKHFFIKDGFFSDPWTSLGERAPTANATACPPPPPPPSEAEECSMRGPEWYWNGGECVFTPGSPIIVDLGRDGYHLTNVENGVLFDLNADGTAEHVSWTQADSDDAFLAMDRNGNGRIDDGSELFGNHTPVYADRFDVRARNGFDALNFLEGPGYGVSTFDQVIDRRDAVFSRLLLWRDLNHNGISETEELQTLESAGVSSISSIYKEKKRVDGEGNEFRLKSQIVWMDGTVDSVYDVWLRRRQ
jgi:hypothetical protein